MSGASRSQVLIHKPRRKVMGRCLAPPCAHTGKVLVPSDFSRWQERASSFLCVIVSSWMLVPPQSCCPSLSYCFCNLLFSPVHIVKLLYKTWNCSAPKLLSLSLVQLAPSLFCALLSTSSACLLFM